MLTKTIAIAVMLGLATSASAVTTVTIEAAGVQATTLVVHPGIETFDNVGGYTSPYITTFGGSAVTGTFSAVLPSNADQYGGAGGTGRYSVVQGVSVLTLTGAATDYFGLWASALDGGNSISFYRAGTLVDTIDLADYPLSDAYRGNPNANYLGNNAGEKYAFFNVVIGGGFDEVHLIQNNGGGFELDNVTVASTAAVPEPAAWALLLAGFGLVGTALRGRRTALSR